MFLLGKHSWPVVNILGRLTWVVFIAETGPDPAHGPVLIPIRLGPESELSLLLTPV